MWAVWPGVHCVISVCMTTERLPGKPSLHRPILLLPWCTSPPSALFTLHVLMTSLLSLTCVCLCQQVSFEWCYGVCCPLFFCLLSPQLVEADGRPSWFFRFDWGFFLLKGSFFYIFTSCKSPIYLISIPNSGAAIERQEEINETNPHAWP